VPLGIYLSVPFCRSKCTYCNFASDVFSRAVFEHYVDRVCGDIDRAEQTAARVGGGLERAVTTIYLGGGTPTVLAPAQLERIFGTISQNFEIEHGAEIAVECAPATLTDEMLATLGGCGVNRVSLGVQSFVDAEARAVGRLHTRTAVLDDIARLRAAGMENISIDLIAGLPHQTQESWDLSLEQTAQLGVPHVSVYMLEVDEDSRLGRELIAGGTKYHAHFVPDEDLTTDLYESACRRLEACGIRQYEISNFARPGSESRHNLKYWTRQPYFGFGVDAHSMLHVEGHFSHDAARSVRFQTPDSLEAYLARNETQWTRISPYTALEENFFLGLRLNQGVDLREISVEFGGLELEACHSTISELVCDGLLDRQGNRIRLTPRGRLLSNEVFARFISSTAVAG